MTRGTKIALIVSSAVVIIAGITTAIVISKRRKDKKEEAEKLGLETDNKGEVTTISESVGAEETTTGTKQPSNRPPLKIGSRGRWVGTLQMALNHIHGLSLKIDGRFGNDVAEALRDNEGYWCRYNVTQMPRIINPESWLMKGASDGCPVTTKEYNEIYARAKKKSGWKEYVKSVAQQYKKVTDEYSNFI